MENVMIAKRCLSCLRVVEKTVLWALQLLRHAGAVDAGRTHLCQHLVQPLQRPVQVQLYPAGGAGHSLTPEGHGETSLSRRAKNLKKTTWLGAYNWCKLLGLALSFLWFSQKERGIYPTHGMQSCGNPPLHVRVSEICSPPTPCPLHSSSISQSSLVDSQLQQQSPSLPQPSLLFLSNSAAGTWANEIDNTYPDAGERFPLMLSNKYTCICWQF